jgi:hypothetical protein
MKLYNPYEEEKKGNERRLVAACVWEALRHNQVFQNFIKRSQNDPTNLTAKQEELEVRLENSRLGFYAAISLVDASILEAFPGYGLDHQIESPELSTTWTSLPEDYKENFSKICSPFLGIKYTSKYGQGTEIDLDLGKDLLKICEDEAEKPELALQKIKALILMRQDHILSLPVGKYSAKWRSDITKQVSQRFEKASKSHGNEKVLPSKQDWECFLTYQKNITKGRSQNQSYSMVLHEHDLAKWEALIDTCNQVTPSDPTEAFQYVDEGVKEWKSEHKMPLMKHIENVTKFSDWLWHCPEST